LTFSFLLSTRPGFDLSCICCVYIDNYNYHIDTLDTRTLAVVSAPRRVLFLGCCWTLQFGRSLRLGCYSGLWPAGVN
jgi:hypothetical protein